MSTGRPARSAASAMSSAPSTGVRSRRACSAPLVVVVVAVLFAGSAWLLFGQAAAGTGAHRGSRAGQRPRLGAADRQPRFHPHADAEDRRPAAALSSKAARRTSIFSISGFGSNTSSGFITLTLAPWEKRDAQPADDLQRNQRACRQCAGRARLDRGLNSLGIRGGGSGMQFAVVGPNYEQLATTAQEIADKLGEDPRFGRVSVNYNATQPQLTLDYRPRQGQCHRRRHQRARDDHAGHDRRRRCRQRLHQRRRPIRCACSRPRAR